MSDNNKFQQLLKIVETLRSEQGCPWDRKQTPVTMKPYLLEETHELAEAITKDDVTEIREEIGDLFFQLTLIARMYQEKEEFRVEDCLQAIIDKMIRRHPHVFQGKEYGSTEELRADWQEIKKKEKKDSQSQASTLDVPKSLPALSRAQRVIHRSCRQGKEIQDRDYLISSLDDKMKKLTRSMQQSSAEIGDNLGKLLLELMHVGRLFNIYCEDQLKEATDEYISQQEKN